MKDIKVIVNKVLPFEGEKIILDNIDVNDLVIVKKSSVKEGFEKFTCRPVHEENEEDMRDGCQKLLDCDKCCILGVYDKNSRKIAGHISIFDYNPRNRAVETGYHLLENYRNQGYMKESLNILKNILFKEVKLNKIMAQTGSFNKESNALLKSCGFSLDGRLRRHHELNGELYDDNLYSILKEEYK